jgi:uncharacterized membrane protein YeiH
LTWSTIASNRSVRLAKCRYTAWRDIPVGLPALRRFTQPKGLTVAAYVSIVFMLVSWWPHDNMHRVLSHHDLAGLARIEYAFHVTSIAAAATVGLFFLRTVKTRA